jgi:hypothetical protein
MGLAPLAVTTLWWREITRFRRQRSRVFGALGQPLVFWLLLGGGLSARSGRQERRQMLTTWSIFILASWLWSFCLRLFLLPSLW